MTTEGIWRVRTADGVRLARGHVSAGPQELLPQGLDLDDVLGGRSHPLGDLVKPGIITGTVPVAEHVVIAPVQSQPVWAAGVTYERSRDARIEESDSPDFYERVYGAERPELFFKSAAVGVRGPGEPIGVRADSAWNLPEPELGLVLDHTGRIVGCVIGNDVSSRSIEGENPLYLPQAKVYRGSCAIGPCIVPIEECGRLRGLTIEMTIRRDAEPLYRESVRVADMHREPEDLADWLFRGQDFPYGVVLLTGTSMVPPSDFTLLPGDEVTIGIADLGSLVNTVETIPA